MLLKREEGAQQAMLLLNMEADREYAALYEGMQYAVEHVRASKFFTDLIIQIQENTEMVSNFKGAPLVVYGLGSLQYNHAAKFHLSLALLLREVTGLQIQKEITICCDDITLTPAEEKVMKAYGCHVVLVTDGRFRWTVVDEPILFFLPYTRPEILGHLLQMNWCPSRLEKMLILGKSLKSMVKTLDPMVSRCNNSEGHPPKMTIQKLSYVRDKLRYIWAIKEHTEEFKLTSISSSSVSESQDYNPEQMFDNLCWHAFNVNRLNIIEDMDILLPSTETCFKWVDSDERYPYRMDEEDAEELVKLQHEMEITKIELRNSEHYRKLRDQLEEDHFLKNEISRRLGTEEQIQMIIYGLGSLEYSFASQYQFALALLMREDIDMLRIGQITVFDPLITPSDANLIRSFGCNVFSVNEFGRRRVEKPTFFFLPFVAFNLIANLLEMNWVPSKLENLIILGTSMHAWAFFSPNSKYKWRFNSTDAYRVPCKHCKKWNQPPPGWIKLNFDGCKDTNGNYGYGGILHDCNGDTLLSYAGPLSNINIENGGDDDAALLVAQVEGLRQGVRYFKKWLPYTYDDPNLFIEGSAVSVIKWARAMFPPPSMLLEAFKEMCELLEGINCQVHHIYQEANIEANQLAQQGVTLSHLDLWS
ncbi:Ribonuclease H-like protein [Dioscorea alata]|uniref:Ribonuclease H-like protein n=2 Tax=Dioscorea alata TaxID=55571 RepID=A0ACB7VZ94_DIOAL|nr:Ribonuclease H-like protein [Dioscorea alata]KAH7679981.1 Ribonuclease H-like protein [Dioscorea alata]